MVVGFSVLYLSGGQILVKLIESTNSLGELNLLVKNLFK